MYIVFDTETGGIGTDYSLLSAYFLAVDDNFKEISSLDLPVKPDDDVYRVCGRAMEVNKINLAEHDKIALPYKEAGTRLYNWLRGLTNDGADKSFIVGHNVGGDRDMICRHLLSRGSWEKFTSYRLRDTQASAVFLIDCGILPTDLSGSLSSLAEFFGVNVDQNQLHNARVDAETTLKVYMALRELVINLNNERLLQRYVV